MEKLVNLTLDDLFKEKKQLLNELHAVEQHMLSLAQEYPEYHEIHERLAPRQPGNLKDERALRVTMVDTAKGEVVAAFCYRRADVAKLQPHFDWLMLDR